VNDFLWGYQDNLVTLANSIMPDYIHFEKFGLMDRLLDEGINEVSIHLPKAVEIINQREKHEINFDDQPEDEIIENPDDVQYEDDFEENLSHETISALSKQPKENEIRIRDFSIDLWNGSPGLKPLGYDERYSAS
jgi:hypothetical protein